MKLNFFDSPEMNLQSQSNSILDIKQAKNKRFLLTMINGVIVFKIIHVLCMILFNMEERL